MSFLNPNVLYYMLPPLFILFGLLLTQKEAQGNFFSDEVMKKLRVSSNTLTIKARNALFLVIGILLVITLAGPVIKDGTIVVKAKSADIMIALDISDSMLAEDVYPNRLKLAKEKAMEFLKLAPDERVGVIAFAKNSYLVSPMSFDHSAVGFLLRQLNTDSITEKGTNFLSLLHVVNKSIKKESKKYLLIVSDGGDKSDFSEEIAYAKEKNIVVFILGVGTTKGAPIKKKDGSFIKHNGEIIVSKLNEDISDFATSTTGVYIQSVKSNSDVKAMLSEINSISEQRELKSEEVQKFIPLFYYPLGVALLLLLIATSSMAKRESLQIPSVFILFAMLMNPLHVEAGVLDFMQLKEAKDAYEKGEYEKSAQLYSEYAEVSKNGESYFNEANALYKQGKFDEALSSYQKATFDTDKARANNSANMGNAFVKQAKPESLEKAVKAYEKSLELNEDKNVRENLEAVKKEIEKQKKEQEKKKKDDDKKDDKKDKDKKEKQDKKNDESKDGEDSKDDSKDKEKSDKKDDSSKSKESKDKNKENSDDMKSKKEQEESQNKENNETSPQDKKDDLEQLKKNENNTTKEPGQGSAQAYNQDKMSDAEEKKWLDQLNMQQNTYMYMLNDNKEHTKETNEKPW